VNERKLGTNPPDATDTGRRASEDARFRALINHASDIITVVDAEGFVRYESPAIAHVLGHPPGTSIGARIFRGVHPDDAYRAWSYLNRVQTLPGPQPPVEIRYEHLDGSWRTLELRGTNLLRDPHVNGIVFNSRDITEKKANEELLRRQEQQLRALVEHAPDVISRVDNQLRYVYVNPAIEDVIGMPVDAVLGRSSSNMVARTTVGAYWHAIRKVFDTHRESTIEFDYPTPTGQRWFQARLIPELSSTGQVETVLSIARDVTDFKRAAEQLREAESRYRTLVEHIPAVTYIDQLAEVTNATWVSPQIESLLGFTPDEWLAQPFLERVHSADRERVTAALRDANRTLEPFTLEYRLLAHEGRVVWRRDQSAVVRDDQGQPLYWQGILLDITLQKELEQQLAYQAFHDPLTDLPNRALFADRLQHALARAQRHHGLLAVLCIDLDDFKVVNDSLGHEAGDELLRVVAARLHASLRAGDTAARFGGDEFTVLLEDLMHPEETEVVAARLVAALAAPVTVREREFVISASVGIALSYDGDLPAEELLRRADVAMYRAKSAGKGRCELFTALPAEEA
jgi:diguanylate cyclase (GGDEF)-like protein/PAS domain S-box-containing protein